jgi:aryl-alcohol dehydrogenase-like predicted oxidoreductase
LDYRPFGRTGVKVSEMCLGTMMFDGRADKDESFKIIDHAMDRGVNFIDTANVYAGNESERIVGEALARDGKRRRTILATKAHGPQSDDINDRGISRRHLIDACEASLRRLQTDWIDLYQLHRSRADTPIDETLRALDDLIRGGKVRYIGTSMFPGWQMVEALWVATPQAWDTIDLVKTIAAEKGCSPSQVALAWCGAQPGVTAPIIGPRTYEQAADNIGAVDVKLTPDDMQLIDALVPPCGVAVRYYDRANGLDLRPHLQRVM